jgi:hypothetical protein
MSYHNPSRNYYERQPYRVPGYLPFAQPLSPGDIAVPNEAFGFWPQGQFAPEFFPAGHASFSRFRYPDYSDDEVLGDAYYDGWGSERRDKRRERRSKRKGCRKARRSLRRYRRSHRKERRADRSAFKAQPAMQELLALREEACSGKFSRKNPYGDPGLDYDMGGVYQDEFALDNPTITVDTRAVLMTIGVFALGFATAHFGWDEKIRAAVKAKL